ncbi:ABC transporter permease, partial [Rhizobium ruizarguesonis]
MKHFARWGLTMPATIAVVVLLIVPVAITIAATFAEPKGIFAPYVTFFSSGFRRAVLYRTLEVALVTT